MPPGWTSLSSLNLPRCSWFLGLSVYMLFLLLGSLLFLFLSGLIPFKSQFNCHKLLTPLHQPGLRMECVMFYSLQSFFNLCHPILSSLSSFIHSFIHPFIHSSCIKHLWNTQSVPGTKIDESFPEMHKRYLVLRKLTI